MIHLPVFKYYIMKENIGRTYSTQRNDDKMGLEITSVGPIIKGLGNCD